MRVLLILMLMILPLSCSSGGEAKDMPVTTREAEGARLLAAGQVEEALEVFRTAAYEERSYRGLVGMAHCYARLGDIGRFETISMEAASRSPRTVESFRRLGVLFVKGAERFRMRPASSRFAQVGVEYLRRVYAVQPQGDPDLLPTLGLGLHLAEMDDSAAVILNEALLGQPDRVDVIHSLLSVYRRLGDRERTKALLARWQERSDLPAPWVEAWNWAQGESR